MTDESGDDATDHVVIPRPETSYENNGEPPHVIREIKTWLSPTDTTPRASEYRKHLNSHAAGTGEWILDTEQYRRWSDTDEIGDLWIRGIPGSGKSVVAASMIRRLQQRADAPVAFFFFREIIEANRTPQALARDFCHGLIDHSPILQSSLEKLKSNESDVQTVPFSEFWNCLSSALTALPKVYCVVDALDEMESGHDQFLQDLLDLGRKSPKSIKLLLTSRQLPHLEKHLGGSCLLDLRLDRRNVDRDIAVYITRRLEAEATLTEEEAGAIKTAICDRGGGLFLYARLVTDQLLLHPITIVSQLNQLPNGLGSMYTDILREHAARSQTTTEFQRLILEWIIFSMEPLRLLELATIVEALPGRGGLSENQNVKLAIRSTCGPLLEVCEDGVIQIIHHSLTEFLLSRDVSHVQDAGDHREFPVLEFEVAHENIARSCIDYIVSCCPGHLDESTQKTSADRRALWQRFPFLQYASENWTYHAYMLDPSQEFISFLEGFCNQSASFAWWIELWNGLDIRFVPKEFTLLHLASHCGFHEYVEHLLANGADPECLDGYYRTPITYAAIQGHSGIVQTLLNHKARYDLVDDALLTPLHYAAKLNRPEVVSVLLAEGANPLQSVPAKIKTESGVYRGRDYNYEEGETALSYACRLGHVPIFLELQSYMEPSKMCRGFLHLAAQHNQAQIVRLLLKHEEVRRAINDHNDAGNTALYVAAKYHDAASVKSLLESGADVNIRSLDEPTERDGPRVSQQTDIQEMGFTPIHGWAQLFALYGMRRTACEARNPEVLERLIKAGSDVNATDHKGRTALFAWTEHRDFALVSALLDNGADPSRADLDGATPLHRVKYSTKEEVLELFMQAGADINAVRKSDGMTPVHVAAKARLFEDPINFSRFNADFKKQDLEGDTPLHYVCQEWSRTGRSPEPWVSLGDLDIQNHAGRTLLAEFLEHACQEDDRNNVGIFIEHGASLESRDYQGRTALLTSLSREFRHRRERVPELLRLGADVKATDYEGKSALHYAVTPRAFSGDENVRDMVFLLKMLIDAGADINSVDNNGDSVFHDTIEGAWRYDYTEALLEVNAPLNMRNHQGRTALHIAAARDTKGREATKNGTLTFFEFLLQPELGFDINAQDHQGVTPLHLAAATSDITTRHLIDLGANIQAKTTRGQTPLHYAAEAGQSNSVGLLLEAYAAQTLPVDDLTVKGRTALHEAARSGRYESVKLLLDAGSRPNICDTQGRTPLHAAAEFDQFSTFSRRRKRYDATEKNAEQRPDETKDMLEHLGLIISSEEDSPSVREVVQLLLEAGIDPAQVDTDKQTASDTALLLGSSDVVDELAPSIARLNASTENCPRSSALNPVGEALAASAREGLAQFVDTMSTPLDNGIVLKRVISAGRVKLLEELLCSAKANLTGNDITTALHFCAQWGLLSMARSLLPYVQNLHSLLPSLLDSATKRSLCNIDMINLLLGSALRVPCSEEGARPEDCKKFNAPSALHRVASGRYWWHPQALTILLKAGADTELLMEGRTPLQTALRAGRPDAWEIGLWCDEVFDVLLRFGADVNASSAKSEMSPLQDAVESKREISLVRRLLDHGASLEGNPVLASAIRADNTTVLELLLKAGADPNVLYTTTENQQDNKPETPLKHASGRNESLMELLLAHGANPHLPLFDGTSSVLHEICSLNGRLNPIIKGKYDLETRDAQGRTPLLRACILDRDPYCLTRSPRNEESSAIELIRAGVDVNTVDDTGSTALHYAICSGLDVIVKELLSHGASSVTRNKHGSPPLHSALTGLTDFGKTPYEDDYPLPSPGLLHQLLAAGADPLEPLPDGRTALHCIIPGLMQYSEEGKPKRKSPGQEKDNDLEFCTYKALYQTFVDAGCSREARDNHGNTPIFAYVRRIKFYHSDIERRVAPDLDDMRDTFAAHDIHAVNNVGDTLLHAVASREEDWEDLQDHDVMIFELLVDLGLDPAAENKAGATPLDVAAAWDRDEILALFARDE